MLIAVPSDTTTGLDSTISEHFGHCGAFTLVTVENGEIGEVSILENGGHEQGGCMAPVQLLKEHGVEILLSGGMGPRPLSGFQQVGIAVHLSKDVQSVRDAVDLYLSGGCPAFGEAQTCGGGSGGGCGGHHDVEIHRDPIEVPCADAFGEPDEARIIEVSRTQLAPDAKVGDMVATRDQSGRQVPLIIVHLDDETARLDGNHPFAGKDVVFNITVARVENATADELAHNHAH